jgi:hypothetical protein
LLKFFDDPRNPYPYVTFNEDGQSLDGIMTCVGIVLPEKIYEGAAVERSNGRLSMFRPLGDDWVLSITDVVGTWIDHQYNTWERDLVLKLNEYSLAK